MTRRPTPGGAGIQGRTNAVVGSAALETDGAWSTQFPYSAVSSLDQLSWRILVRKRDRKLDLDPHGGWQLDHAGRLECRGGGRGLLGRDSRRYLEALVVMGHRLFLRVELGRSS